MYKSDHIIHDSFPPHVLLLRLASRWFNITPVAVVIVSVLSSSASRKSLFFFFFFFFFYLNKYKSKRIIYLDLRGRVDARVQGLGSSHGLFSHQIDSHASIQIERRAFRYAERPKRTELMAINTLLTEAEHHFVLRNAQRSLQPIEYIEYAGIAVAAYAYFVAAAFVGDVDNRSSRVTDVGIIGVRWRHQTGWVNSTDAVGVEEKNDDDETWTSQSMDRRRKKRCTRGRVR